MAQLQTATSDISNFDPNTLVTKLNNVRSRILADKTVRAQDIIDIAWVYNTWVGHTHGYFDYYWIAYGNTSPYSTHQVKGTSNGVLGGVTYVPPIVGSIIAADAVNLLVDLINSVRSHTHYATDNSW